MRIKKIELVGFKSFKDRTVIQFDAGITGIVGPNGCGKSNIVDALVWVMGEMSAKDLRGSTMTDVIFAGAENYAPMGMCEVNLTLENDGGPFPVKYLKHTEIMVTRRLHRSGEGEYFINKEPARLKDVQEIFMDTGAGSKGFSIIQQGTIGKIITSKPEDRRMLIEEAAGITKFKVRKKESVRKLQATDQNLIRLQDIVGELKRQIDSLQRQAQRAERYRTIKNQIEELDLWLSSRSYNELKDMADEALRIYQDAQGMEVEGETQLSDIEAQLQLLKLRLVEKERTVEEMQLQHSLRQSKVQKNELEIQELKFEIEQARRNEQMTGNLLHEQQARHELLEKDAERLSAQVEGLSEESSELTSLYQEKNEYFQSAQARIQEIDEELTTKRRELFGVGQSESSLDARSQSLNQQINDLLDREENENLVVVELREKLVSFQERRDRVSGELNQEKEIHGQVLSELLDIEATRRSKQDAVAQKKMEVDEFKDHLNETASRLYGLENLQANLEGFQEGVKQVILWQKTKQSEVTAEGSVVPLFQPVSEVVDVPSEYEIAMEAALGSRLQMLLGADEGLTLDAVDYLKEQKSGRSSFWAGDSERYLDNSRQEKLHRADGLMRENGVRALLRDVVRSSEKYQNAVAYLLNGVVVVDGIRTALALRPRYPDWTFVTMDGDTLGADGVLTGGATEGADSGMLKRRREIKELSEKKDEWAGKLALAQASLRKLEEDLSELETAFESCKARKTAQEIRVAELRKDVERAENEFSNAQYAVERQEREVRKIQEQLKSQQDKYEEMREVLLETSEKKTLLEETVESLNEDLISERLGFESLQTEVTDLQVRSAAKNQEYQGVQRQLEMVQKSLGDLGSQLSKMSEESQHYSILMSESQLALEQRKIDFEKLLQDLEELRLATAQEKDIYEQMESQVREMEEQAMHFQKSRNERQSRMNEAQLKLQQARMKEQYLLDQIRERYMLNLTEVYPKYIEKEGDVAQVEAELKENRERLAKIGEVNLAAIEEYKETAERYEFLTQQQSDLTEAKENLRRVIDRINRICSKRFKETFDLVNDRFTRVFPVLFGGGEAKLELHEDPEKGEMGIEIIARPPGKKMQNVSLMSGGEKALTAVALVFSIFLVKPSPYCLLDEVDAPLDDANVFRFNDLVREMAKRSQIIVVTHNKHTMEVAGKLYGVTMQERGVSTMVSVSLEDIK